MTFHRQDLPDDFRLVTRVDPLLVDHPGYRRAKKIKNQTHSEFNKRFDSRSDLDNDKTDNIVR